MRGFLAGLAVALLAGCAAAQGTIQQSGPVTPFHAPTWLQNGVQADGGTPAVPAIDALGIFGGASCPLGVSSQTGAGNSKTPHSLFTLCQTDGATTFTFAGVNGEPTPDVFFNIGGTSYPFPGPGNGDVLGPLTSTAGNQTCFNASNGTIIIDCANFATPAAATPLNGADNWLATQSGSTVKITVADILAQTTPIAPLPGTKHDAVPFSDGAMSSGSSAFSGPSETFTNSDVGKGIVIVGAGPQVAATGYLDLIQNAHANDTFTVGTTTITAVASGASGSQFNIGASAALSATALASFITTNTSTLHVTAAVTGAAGSAHISVTANATGTSGNTIALSASCGYDINDACGAERVAVSNATLLGGATSSTLYGTISALTDSHHVTINPVNGCSTHACNSVSGANGYYATDDAAAINADLANGQSNVYQAGPFNYGIGSTITPPTGISLRGQGENWRFYALAPVTMLNDNQVSGLGVDLTDITQLYFEGGGLAPICFYTGPYVVKDKFELNFASDCVTGFEIDGTQNSHFTSDETSNQLIGSTGSGAGSPIRYSFRVLNGASGNHFDNDEAAGASVRSWQFAPDSGEPGYNTFPGGTNQGPLSNLLSGGIEENGCASSGAEFVGAGFTTWTAPVYATGGCSSPAGPNVIIGAGSFFIEIDGASFNAGGSNRGSSPALLNNGFEDTLGTTAYSGTYGAASCLVVGNGSNLNLPSGLSGLDSAGYKTCNNNGNATPFGFPVKLINGEPNVTTNQLNAGGLYETAFGRVFECTPLFGVFCQAIHFDSATTPSTFGATINTNMGTGITNYFTVMTGNATQANPTNLQSGMRWSYEFVQDSTGSRTLAFDTLYRLPGGAAGACGTLTPNTGATDYFEFYYDGAQIITTCFLNMKS